jgi:hypothetical protein
MNTSKLAGVGLETATGSPSGCGCRLRPFCKYDAYFEATCVVHGADSGTKKGSRPRATPTILAVAAAYQMRARCSGGMYMELDGVTPNAWYQASTLRIGPSTRKRPGLCGSVVTWLRIASSRCFSRHTWA